MTRRLRHSPHGQLVPDEPAEPQPQPLALLELQRRMGNAAVSRLLAREPADAPPFQYARPGPLPAGAPNPLFFRPELQPDVEREVDAWLRLEKPGILAAVAGGAISMAEVVDRVRRHVPAATSASAEAIRARVSIVVGEVPQTRARSDLGGRHTEQAARISNMLPSPPRSVTISGSKTSLTIAIKEAELKTAAAGAHVAAKADDEGAEAELRKGDAKLGASAKWDGSEFAVKTEVSGVKFGAGVRRSGDSWRWTGGLTFQLAGDEVDEIPDVGAAVAGAHAAIGDSLGHLQRGGALADGYVSGRMAAIKPAIDAARQVAGRTKSGATVRVTASGEDGGFTAGVSLVIVF